MRAFDSRCVVITGAAGGLGGALVRAFRQMGAHVVALDRAPQALQALQREESRHSESTIQPLMSIVCDVTSFAACAGAMARVTARHGGIDVLINNAGISHRSVFSSTQGEVLRRVMEVNFFGAVHCTRAAIDSLRTRRGLIIAISSVAGFSPLIGRTGYAASKHALHGFFDSLRTEVEGDGVGVLMVCPSFIDTGIDRAALGPQGEPARQARQTTGVQAQPENVAAAIVVAARAERRLLLFGATAKAAWWLSKLWPARYAAIMKHRLKAEIFTD